MIDPRRAVTDPRLAVIRPRLASVQRIVAVTGGKGGIGKSLVASTLALSLAAAGRRTGLLDLDFTGPCDHLVIGAPPGFPQEDFGILPQVVAGVHFMSMSCFAGQAPAPLRGSDGSNALIELLAITRWGDLDMLVVDMPPGLGDMALDAVRLLPRAEYLVVSSAALMVAQTVRRTLSLLQRLDRRTLGVVENMALVPADPPSHLLVVSAAVKTLAADHEVPVLGVLPQDGDVEAALGDPAALLTTQFATAIATVAQHLN